LGLRPDRFTVLVCGGADGSGGIARRARALAATALDLQLAVVCGHNRQALRQVQSIRPRGPDLVARGFVTNMADWVRASDVVATKAGPGTIAEALCCGTPLLLTWYLPGQERSNIEWVIDSGAGRYVPKPRQLVDAVTELAAPNSAPLDAMRHGVQLVARPEATAHIAALIERLASRSLLPAGHGPA
jgi:1,2-diacylglycerol 3-beta-galactosyltransferase